MAVTSELLRNQLDALRLPVATSLPASIASCRDACLPIYSFSPVQRQEKVSKLARVESMPVVPDVMCEPTCDSPTLLAGAPSYCLADGSFDSLSTDQHYRFLQTVPSQLDETGVPYAYDVPLAKHSVDSPVVDSLDLMMPLSRPGRQSLARALPRRHPSDVFLASHAGGAKGCYAADDSGSSSDGIFEVPSCGLLEGALVTLWEDRADRGLFRYDVTQCPSRVLPGRRGFIAQLNEGRATKKRPTELTVDRVMQPFDPAKFNFTKAAISEVLFAFHPRNNLDEDDDGGAIDQPPQLVAPPAGAAGDDSPNLVLINVSPIDYGHVLLVPRVLDRLPQALSTETVLLALQFSRELDSPFFRVGYNSLGAYATINHLHFQSYYLSKSMPCELASTVPLPGALATPPVSAPGGRGSGGGGSAAAAAALWSRKRLYDDMDGPATAATPVLVSRLRGYPVNAFVVEAAEEASKRGSESGRGLQALAAVVGVAAERLQAANQPFNLLICNGGRRVFVFPQCFAERHAGGSIPEELLDTGVNPAAFEIAGHLLLKRAEDFAAADEGFAVRLLAQASLPEERFMALAHMCFGGR